MRCFYHHEKEAIGLCKCCGKGLCPDCAVDLGKGLACVGRCEDAVKNLIQFFGQSMKMSAISQNTLQTASSIRSGVAIFQMTLGLVFMGWGILAANRSMFMLAIGICFFTLGIFMLVKGRANKK